MFFNSKHTDILDYDPNDYAERHGCFERGRGGQAGGIGDAGGGPSSGSNGGGSPGGVDPGGVGFGGTVDGNPGTGATGDPGAGQTGGTPAPASSFSFTPTTPVPEPVTDKATLDNEPQDFDAGPPGFFDARNWSWSKVLGTVAGLAAGYATAGLGFVGSTIAGQVVGTAVEGIADPDQSIGDIAQGKVDGVTGFFGGVTGLGDTNDNDKSTGDNNGGNNTGGQDGGGGGLNVPRLPKPAPTQVANVGLNTNRKIFTHTGETYDAAPYV